MFSHRLIGTILTIMGHSIILSLSISSHDYVVRISLEYIRYSLEIEGRLGCRVLSYL